VTPLAVHGLSDVARRVDPAECRPRAEGVVNGHPDGTFRPDLPVSRGPIAKSVFSQSA